MTLVGKKLQDIYDSGAQTLVELQEQTTKNFERAGKEHAQKTKQSAEKSSLSLQDKSSHLQSELKELMQASMARLENALDTESDRNHSFVISLIAELQMRTEQMKSKLAALEQSHHENVDFAFNIARQHYLSDLETAKINLDESASQHKIGLAGYGATIADKLLQITDQGFWQQYEQSVETSGSFFATAREQERLIADRAASLAQTFSTGCQNKLTDAKTLADRSIGEIETSVRSLLETITKHASSVEKDSEERYAGLTDSHFQKVDASLSDFADELSNLHDGVTDQLLKNTEELSTDLLSASAQAQEALRTKCDQAVESVDSDFAAFKQKVEARLLLNRGQKQTLEEDKNKILIAIKNELLSIHDSFAKKIATLRDSSKSELANMTKSVETKILAAMETCDEQVGTSAASAQKQIEDEVAAFLGELSKSRTAAVEEIKSSAHGNLPLVNMPQNTEKTTNKISDADEITDEKMAVIDAIELKSSVEVKEQSLAHPDTESQIDTNPTESKPPAPADASSSKTTRRHRRRKSEDLAEKDDIEEK